MYCLILDYVNVLGSLTVIVFNTKTLIIPQDELWMQNEFFVVPDLNKIEVYDLKIYQRNFELESEMIIVQESK